jgi:hypothetical protein
MRRTARSGSSRKLLWAATSRDQRVGELEQQGGRPAEQEKLLPPDVPNLGARPEPPGIAGNPGW